MVYKKGMTGPEISNLQRVLIGLGFSSLGEADGNFGIKTENVIKYIQRTNGLEVDGIVGPATMAVIQSKYDSKTPKFTSSSMVAAGEAKYQSPSSDSVPMGPTREKLSRVHPKLGEAAIKMIGMADSEGHVLRVSQGLRTFEEQNRLYAKRPRVTRAKGGQSYHNYGVAVDFVFYVKGRVTWDTRYYESIGKWASQAGLEWGGNWRFKDMPHCQLRNAPHFSKLLVEYNKYGGGYVGVRAVWDAFFK